MEKELIKKELESYSYDYQYFIEKSKEREKYKEEVQRSIVRIKALGDPSLDISINNDVKRIMEQEAEEEIKLLDILSKRQRIENCIKKLDQPEKTIMYLRYMRFLTFDQIAEKMHYSTKRIYQLHALALEHFAIIFSDNPQDSNNKTE